VLFSAQSHSNESNHLKVEVEKFLSTVRAKGIPPRCRQRPCVHLLAGWLYSLQVTITGDLRPPVQQARLDGVSPLKPARATTAPMLMVANLGSESRGDLIGRRNKKSVIFSKTTADHIPDSWKQRSGARHPIRGGGVSSIGAMMVRILLADNHIVIRSGLRALLQTRRNFHICGETHDG
jgi:hypothetical protein